jgi:hypothetical protein
MSATQAAHEFWTSEETSSRHEEIAKTFEQNIKRYHPETVTSNGMCVCMEWCSYCSWAGTKVDYYEYNGPDVKNI